MRGPDVFSVLRDIGAKHLYHANSVTTSSTFLENGGLLSRGFVEDHGLQQTAQSSDESDKKNEIWHDIFLDHVDIHHRALEKNLYGPVLFQFDLSVLLGLRSATQVRVTKKNPIYWDDTHPDSELWFQTKDELAEHIQFGDFGKMLVIKTQSEKLDFPNKQAMIILDDPRRKLSSGEDAYTHAEMRLKSTISPVKASIGRRKCQPSCTCTREYAEDADEIIGLYFT